jgi:ParB-like chromosome segregation protein Spo0J
MFIERGEKMKEYFLDKMEKYDRLIKEWEVSQSELARRLNVSQATVCNHLRIKKLDKKVIDCMKQEGFCYGKTVDLMKYSKQLKVEQMIKIIRYTIAKDSSVERYRKLLQYEANKNEK